MSYKDEALAKIAEFEGVVPWMYLDTRGNVTVGVGRMLPDAVAALHHPFYLKGNLALASDVIADFNRVKAMQPAMLPHAYYAFSSPTLHPADITADLACVVAGFETQLRNAISTYDALPDSWKTALLDMAYNLGPDRLLREYPHFLTAVKSGNGQAAMAQCNRQGIGIPRNDWTRAQFWPPVS